MKHRLVSSRGKTRTRSTKALYEERDLQAANVSSFAPGHLSQHVDRKECAVVFINILDVIDERVWKE